MPSRPVFVTAYFSVYPRSTEPPADERKTFPSRLGYFRQVLLTGIQMVLFTDCVEPFVELLQEFRQTFRIGQVLWLSDTNFYREFHHQIKRLPTVVNPDKDTAEFMWVMMLKTEFLERAIRLDVFQTQSTVYAWIDFSLAYIFKSPEGTLSFLKTFGNTELEMDTVYIPGCWGEPQTKYFDQQILWRFCGGIVLGNTKHLLEMNRLVMEKMPEFLESNSGTLTWEVNYWAWLEYRGYIHPTWYYADHDDWMLLGIPSRACIGRIFPLFQQGVSCPALTATSASHTTSIDSKWSPSSACFFRDTENQCWLLVRYVNYRLDNQGSYLFPDIQDCGIIQSQNVLLKVVMNADGFYETVPESACLAQLSEDVENAPRLSFSMSVGFEDVRLWTDQQGNTCYIATNVDKTTNGLPQIATGLFKMAMATATFSTMTVHQTEHMQKNWIPWTDDEVIYKWCLDGVVFRHLTTGEQRLVPFKIHNAILSRVRGSSIFIPGWNSGELVAIVHYSEEDTPRKYYHLLVILDEKTGELLRHTLPFYLGDVSTQENGGGGHRVNFCIGFDWTQKQDGKRLFHFWFSVMDRDPQYWVVEDDGGFRWCSYEGVISTFSLHKKWIE